MARTVTTTVAVVGGMNSDICGTPAGKLVLRDSNPGTVSVRPGGVGRNIAHDLRLLGLDAALLSAVGSDHYGDMLLAHCRSLGIDTHMTVRLAGERSSAYLYVTDEDGDMQAAVADMEIMARLSPAQIAPWLEELNSCAAVVLDANLEAETIDFIAKNVRVPLYADAVSTGKAARLRGALGRLFCLKPNILEAETLTGERDPERAARALIAAGVGRVFLSMGAQGMLAAERDTLLYLPCEQARVINTTGAGDAVTAALVWAGVRGLTLEQSLRFALRAGAITTECADANNPRLAELARDFA